MKKVLSYILISAIVFVNLLAPFSVGFDKKNSIQITKSEARAADCVINREDITFNGGVGLQDTKTIRPDSITMDVKSAGCVGKVVSLQITSVKNGGIDTQELTSSKYLISEGKDNFSFQLKTGEKTCDGTACDNVYFSLTTEDLLTKDVNAVNSYPISYLCLGKDPDNSVHCSAGTGTLGWNIWSVVQSTLLPYNPSNLLAGKYYYTIKSGSTTQKTQTVTSSKPFDTKPLCQTAWDADTGSVYASQNGNYYDKTPCELFDPNATSKTTKTVEYYTYDITITKDNIEKKSKSSAFYAVGTMTALDVCNKSRDAMLANKTDGLTLGDCVKSTTTQIVTGSADATKDNPSNSIMPACSIMPWSNGTFVGCIAQAFYYVLFVPTSYLFALSGLFFDSTFAYSVQDTSYRSSFVVQGWGLIRDFCNMLFIFIMLYVAIGTTLSLNSMKTKETIVNVVIIGLFINFSLFTTQLIIDASNITARVFYNSNTITLTEKGVDGAATTFTGATEGGVIPLSSALVNKVNPQNLILKATEINNVSNQSSDGINSADKGNDAPPGGIGPGQFILIVIMASGVNIVGFTVFLTIGFLFIARVIGLWLAMILSPLAFFTYILPEMAGTKMVGWKNWWPETLKMAFLAPVFIFFLYIILKFLQTDLISDASSKSGIAFFVATLIPFAFIMILMLKAKKIATDMSGEFGEMATKAGSAVGGLALGGAIGAGAFAMRGTLGAMGDKLSNSDFAKTNGRLGRMLGDAGKWTASKSFDARKTALGGMAGKEMGVDMGKAKEGGYAKHKAEVTQKRRERAESLKLGKNSKEVLELHHAEERLSDLKNMRSNDINRVDGTLDAKRKVASDASQKLTSANAKLARAEKDFETIGSDASAKPEDKAKAQAGLEKARKEAKVAQRYFDKNAEIIADFSQERTELNGSTGRYSHKTANGKVNEKGYLDYRDNVVNKSDAALKEAEDQADKDLLTAITEEEKADIEEARKKAQDKYKSTQKIWKEMQEATKGGTENFEKDENKVESLDNLNLKMIPHMHHEVETENANRINKYSEEIRGRWFNKEANEEAAHEAKMRSEIKKH